MADKQDRVDGQAALRLLAVIESPADPALADQPHIALITDPLSGNQMAVGPFDDLASALHASLELEAELAKMGDGELPFRFSTALLAAPNQR